MIDSREIPRSLTLPAPGGQGAAGARAIVQELLGG